MASVQSLIKRAFFIALLTILSNKLSAQRFILLYPYYPVHDSWTEHILLYDDVKSLSLLESGAMTRVLLIDKGAFDLVYKKMSALDTNVQSIAVGSLIICYTSSKIESDLTKIRPYYHPADKTEVNVFLDSLIADLNKLQPTNQKLITTLRELEERYWKIDR